MQFLGHCIPRKGPLRASSSPRTLSVQIPVSLDLIWKTGDEFIAPQTAEVHFLRPLDYHGSTTELIQRGPASKDLQRKREVSSTPSRPQLWFVSN